MYDSALNLARKWRSKTFDQVVGQELSLRMLKNSLYKNYYFPVYLFSGQRGCGKTTTARLFSSAVNCDKLDLFRQNPKESILPCMSCPSCTAMAEGRHPDFFEIDAASHTGVDTVRQLIDASHLLPILGRKKIYLIDEAHMLSRASFNALLKILEEPPRSVLFILATTDPHKIIETVRSRCFQLFFKPIGTQQLYEHLVQICAAENIQVQEQGLRLIVAESDGSARDALNLLEQVRFSSTCITKQSVLAVLGHIDDEQLVLLVEQVTTGDPALLFAYLHQSKFTSFCPDRLWDRLTILVRACVWVKYGLVPEHFELYEARVKKIVGAASWSAILYLFERLCQDHQLFMRTSAKHALLEMILLQTCTQVRSSSNSGPTGAAAQVMPSSNAAAAVVHGDVCVEGEETEDEPTTDDAALWQHFLKEVSYLDDPLLRSVFQHGVSTGRQGANIQVEFPRQFIFFQELLSETRLTWEAVFKTVFGASSMLLPSFNGTSPVSSSASERSVSEQQGAVQESKNTDKKSEHKIATAPARGVPAYGAGARRSSFGAGKNGRKVHEPVVDISDATMWKTAHMVLSYFPGTLTEVQDSRHG